MRRAAAAVDAVYAAQAAAHPVSSPASSTDSHEADATSSPIASASSGPRRALRRRAGRRRRARGRRPAAPVQLRRRQSRRRRRRLWFVPIVDPDGYDGAPSGVAFDRNWADHWGFDSEGSSDRPARGYRGTPRPSPRSPRSATCSTTCARRTCSTGRRATTAASSTRRAGRSQTPGDRRARVRGAGRPDDAHSAILGYSPGPAGELATANGTLIDTAYRQLRHAGLRRADPDRRRRARRVPQGARASRSTWRTDGDRRTGLRAAHVRRLLRPARRRVEVNARRALGAVSVHWRVAGGPERSEPLGEYEGGERYGAPGAVYHRLRGQVTGFRAGDSVQVWFEGGGETLGRVHVHRRRRRAPRTCSCSPPRTTPARIPARSTPAPST